MSFSYLQTNYVNLGKVSRYCIPIDKVVMCFYWYLNLKLKILCEKPIFPYCFCFLVTNLRKRSRCSPVEVAKFYIMLKIDPAEFQLVKIDQTIGMYF